MALRWHMGACAAVAVLAATAALGQVTVPRPAASVRIRVLWTLDGVPDGMRLHELKPGNWPIWKTGVVKAAKEAPIAGEIQDSEVLLAPGQVKTVALYFTNATPRPVRFFAAPHAVEPAAGALGFKFKCLCTNHVYRVPPGHSWYRVVELRLAAGFAADRLDVRHHLVAVDAARDERFKQGMGGMP